MDYSKLSDFEINRAVAIAIGFHPDECDIAKRGSPSVGVEWNEDTGLPIRVFDYCNNPADAWPIITANKISIYAMSEADKRGGWGAEAFIPTMHIALTITHFVPQ
ncbi:phage protein NinX family protein [Enterobacter hormaechei]